MARRQSLSEQNGPGFYDDGVLLAPGTGGPGATTKMAEVDVGTVARKTFRAVIVDASITATSRLTVQQAGEAATGKQSDEAEMDLFVVTAQPQAGSMVLQMQALQGSLLQKFHRVYYQIG